MKEVMVAKLDKEDSARLKELYQCDEKINSLIAEVNSKRIAFWGELRLKNNLYGGQHYIKGNSIYRQEI